MNTEIVQTNHRKNPLIFLSRFLVWLFTQSAYENVLTESPCTHDWRLVFMNIIHNQQFLVRFMVLHVCVCLFWRGDWMTILFALSEQSLLMGTTCASNIYSFRLFHITLEACAMWHTSNRVLCFLCVAAAVVGARNMFAFFWANSSQSRLNYDSQLLQYANKYCPQIAKRSAAVNNWLLFLNIVFAELKICVISRW